MPITRGQFDYSLNGKGYLLVRPQGGSARSWSRTGIPDVPEHMLAVDIRRGYLDPIINRPDVWNDWSGGFGDAYRNAREPNRYHWSENFDARFPYQLVHCQNPSTVGSNAGLTGSADFNVESFIDLPSTAPNAPAGAGNVLLIGYAHITVIDKATNGLTNFAQLWRPGLSLVGRVATFGSYYYVGVREATGFLQQGNGNAAGMPGRGFVVAASRLWRVHGPVQHNYYLQSCAFGADPTVTANWSATLSIGNGFIDTTALAVLQDQVYLGQADGLYAGDLSGTFFNVLPQLIGRAHIDNCRDLTVYDGQVIAPHVDGIMAYYPSTQPRPGIASAARRQTREIGPPNQSRSPVYGRVRAVYAYAGWLYAGHFTGSQSWLLAGTDRRDGFSWHTLQRLPVTNRVHRLHVDSVVTSSGGQAVPNYFWVAADASYNPDNSASATAVWCWPIPPMDGNPLSAGLPFSANYVGSARMDFGRTDSGVPGVPKAYREVDVWAENLVGTAGGRWGEVWYSLDGSTFQYLDTAATSPRAQLYFPSNAASLATGQDIELSLRSYTTTPNTSPVYRAVILRSALRPDYIDMIQAQTLIGDNLQDRTGHQLRDGATMLRELRDLARQAAPVVLVDLAGATNWVTVMGPIDEQELWQEGDERPQVAATVKMAVMSFTSGRAA